MSEGQSYLRMVILRKEINAVMELLQEDKTVDNDLIAIANAEYREAIHDIESTSIHLMDHFNRLFFNLRGDIYANEESTKTILEVHGVCKNDDSHTLEPRVAEIGPREKFVMEKLNDEETAIVYSPDCQICHEQGESTYSKLVVENLGGLLTTKYSHRLKTGSLHKKLADKMFRVGDITDLLIALDKKSYDRFPENETKEFYDNLFPKEEGKKGKKHPDILDFSGFRFYTETENQCGQMVKLLERMEKKNIIRILHEYGKNYIENPKDNGYQSNHVFINYSGRPHEIQIRTFAMDDLAEKGDASHDKYKKMNNCAREIVGAPYDHATECLEKMFDLSPVS